MVVLGVILRVSLKLGTCIIGGGLVAWIVVGGIVSLFFSTKIMLKSDYIARYKRIPMLAPDIIEELPYTPETNRNPSNETVNEGPRVRVRYRPDWEFETQVFTVYVGLLCGIAWAIENNKARWRFFWWTCGGASVGWVVHLATGNESARWALSLLCLFVGIVSALASVGAYGRK